MIGLPFSGIFSIEAFERAFVVWHCTRHISVVVDFKYLIFLATAIASSGLCTSPFGLTGQVLLLHRNRFRKVSRDEVEAASDELDMFHS